MRLVSLFLALSLAACSGQAEPTTATEPTAAAPAPAPAAGKRTDIAVEAFAEKQAAGVTVIDVRTAEEFAEGHVPGAVLVPVDQISAASPAVAAHPKDQPLYLICRSGGRSARAADLLAKEGYTTVNVEGGTLAWIAAGLPVDK